MKWPARLTDERLAWTTNPTRTRTILTTATRPIAPKRHRAMLRRLLAAANRALLPARQPPPPPEFLPPEFLPRSEEHTSELQSRPHLVCRLLLEKKKKK